MERLARLSRTLVGSGRLGALVTVVTVVAIVADPHSVVAAVVRAVLLVPVLTGAAVQIVTVTGVRLRAVPLPPR